MSHKEFAISLAQEAGKILMDNYGKIQNLEWHLRTNFRTEVDCKSDELIRKRILKNFPEHNIYSEEGKDINNNSEFSWVFDPLDGTIPYTCGANDHFSVCISLIREKTPILGIIYAPKRKELYVAEQGKGAFCNNKAIRVSQEENINHVLMNLDCGKETEFFKRASITQYIEKIYSPSGITCFFASGCASVPLALTAAGKLHAYIALNLEPWDMAAAVIINREAGGKVTTIDGKKWKLGNESILAANPKLHNNFLKFLQDN